MRDSLTGGNQGKTVETGKQHRKRDPGGSDGPVTGSAAVLSEVAQPAKDFPSSLLPVIGAAATRSLTVQSERFPPFFPRSGTRRDGVIWFSRN